jgi:hypothetical protein
VKFNNARFPRIVSKDGKITYCLSPQGEDTLKADKKAFVALMTHIKKIDEAQRTVIMMQVENEVGTYGFARDYAPKAEAQFNQPVPQAVLDHKKSPVPLAASGTWKQVYGDYADEYFHAYSIASYIEEIAKAGRAVYNLPMYVNNAARSAGESGQAVEGELASGGPTYDVLDIYRAAAPHRFCRPRYLWPGVEEVQRHADRFQRPDQPLMVPEMSNAPEYVRYTYGAGPRRHRLLAVRYRLRGLQQFPARPQGHRQDDGGTVRQNLRRLPPDGAPVGQVGV